jgi:hypothetical protein
MFIRGAFFSLLHLLVVFAFLGLGVFFACLPFLPGLRVEIADLFLHRSGELWRLAMICFSAGFFFLVGFYALSRGQFLELEMGRHSAKIDASLVGQTVEECFKRLFPNEIFLRDVEVAFRGRLHIAVFLPALEEEKREVLLTAAERELTGLLDERFGYAKPFHLIVKI